MAKRSGSGKQRRSLIGTILGLIVVVLALIFSQITGIDLLSLLDESTSVPATVQPATVPPADDSAGGTPVAEVPTVGEARVFTIPQGFGAQKDFWQVYFNAPTGSSDSADYTGSIDVPLEAAIDGAESTIDAAIFELNNPRLTQALLRAHERGVTVRIATDDRFGIDDDPEHTTLDDLRAEGIEIVPDGRQSALMHNKFMIIDSSVVWTGSWNYTINGTYRNNNNALVLRSRRAVQAYQAEFDEMFLDGGFGPRSAEGNDAAFTQDGVPIEIVFAPEGNAVIPEILEEIAGADSAIRFMAFSFTRDDIGLALLDRAEDGITVQGIFEDLGSGTRFSELTRLHCAGLPMRQDGNRFRLHHKVFIIDDDTVLTGSFNFSNNATESNDENMVIITEPDLAAQYLAEFDRRWQEGQQPDVPCS